REIIYGVFTTDFFEAVPLARQALLGFAAVSIVAGAVLAVIQTDLKRMLAYSSVSHFGLVVSGLAIANETAVTGGLIHLVGHGIMKGGLFLAVGIFATVAGTRRVDELAGLGRRLPLTSGVFAILAFSMVGVPPAIGFPGKWNIVVGAIEGGEWVIAVVVVASTLLTLGYFGRVVEQLYFAEAQPLENGEAIKVTDGSGIDPSAVKLAVVVVAAVMAVGLGLGVSELVSAYEPVLEVYF
ncbi:MAG: monovalent cation/H+ antiporter subunit D family protein, partial [Halodesulfurarchaeum sp.]|nr:monovalent cation/H+ antiporter subunit D family protein [Halodesulfurarchaeum sp.]